MVRRLRAGVQADGGRGRDARRGRLRRQGGGADRAPGAAGGAALERGSGRRAVPVPRSPAVHGAFCAAWRNVIRCPSTAAHEWRRSGASLLARFSLKDGVALIRVTFSRARGSAPEHRVTWEMSPGASLADLATIELRRITDVLQVDHASLFLRDADDPSTRRVVAETGLPVGEALPEHRMLLTRVAAAPAAPPKVQRSERPRRAVRRPGERRSSTRTVPSARCWWSRDARTGGWAPSTPRSSRGRRRRWSSAFWRPATAASRASPPSAPSVAAPAAQLADAATGAGSQRVGARWQPRRVARYHSPSGGRPGPLG